MSLITYRCVEPGGDEIKYVCEHAYVTGPYTAVWGPADSAAETVLCLPCLNRMRDGVKEIRNHAPNAYKMYALRVSGIQ
jgi:hypothetical protein